MSLPHLPRLSPPRISLHPSAGDIVVDARARTYRFARYPPLAFLVHSWLYVVFGAFLIAAAAQVSFLFPCYGGQTAVSTVSGAPFCVPDASVPSLPSPLTRCDPSVCVARIPVTMQTYAVLLNGALAGRTGALATALYVFMVCMGAPFSAGGRALAVWQRGALIGPSGGFFFGCGFGCSSRAGLLCGLGLFGLGLHVGLCG